MIGWISVEQFYFHINQHKLLVASTAPPRPRAVVVLLSGFGQTKNEYAFFYAKLARQLAQCSIAAYQYDYYGCGDSDGELHEATFELLVNDAQQFMQAVVRQYGDVPLIIVSRGIGTWISAYLEIAVSQWIIWNPVSSNPSSVIHELLAEHVEELIEIADLSEHATSLKWKLFYEVLGNDWWLLRGEMFSRRQLASLLSLELKALSDAISNAGQVLLLAGAAWKYYRHTSDKAVAFEKHPHLTAFHLTPDGQEWAIEQICKFIDTNL